MHPVIVDALGDCLSTIEYSGRGVVVGRTGEGERFMLYWVSGRSDASKNRTFSLGDEVVSILPTDPREGAHDELRHYAALSRRDAWTVAGNGSHVLEVADDLERRVSFTEAVSRQKAEPDPPIWTPRIVAAACNEPGHRIFVGSARASVGAPGSGKHCVCSIAEGVPGSALAVYTYTGTREEVVSAGLPVEVRAADDLRAQVDEIWESLAPDLRVLVLGHSLDAPHPLVAYARQ